jgi:hypothetical protein
VGGGVTGRPRQCENVEGAEERRMTMYCRHCKRELQDGTTCPVCGGRLVRAPSPDGGTMPAEAVMRLVPVSAPPGPQERVEQAIGLRGYPSPSPRRLFARGMVFWVVGIAALLLYALAMAGDRTLNVRRGIRVFAAIAGYIPLLHGSLCLSTLVASVGRWRWWRCPKCNTVMLLCGWGGRCGGCKQRFAARRDAVFCAHDRAVSVAREVAGVIACVVLFLVSLACLFFFPIYAGTHLARLWAG